MASTAEKHQGSVYVCMVVVPARHANEFRLTAAARGINLPTAGAGLRAIRRCYFHKCTSRPHSLVTQEANETAPPAIKNGSVETCLLTYPLSWSVNRSSGRARHIPHLQMLYDHRAVVLGIVPRLAVQEVVPLPADHAVQTRNPTFRLCLINAPLSASRNNALGVSNTLFLAFEPSWVLDHTSGGVHEQIYNSAIDSNRWPRRSHWRWDLNNARDRYEPLVSIANDRTSLWDTFDRTVENGTQGTKFREDQAIGSKVPHFWMWFADRDLVTSLSFPSRSERKPFETSLPGFVEFDKELSTDVPGNICKPGVLGPKRLEFVDLIERGKIDAAIAHAGETHQTLFLCKVPEPAQSVFPCKESCLLLGSRVDPISEGFACDHTKRTLPQESDNMLALSLCEKKTNCDTEDTLYFTSMLTWSLYRSTGGRSSRRMSLRSLRVSSEAFAATSKPSFLRSTSKRTTSICLSSTHLSSRSLALSTPSRECPLVGFELQTLPRFVMKLKSV